MFDVFLLFVNLCIEISIPDFTNPSKTEKSWLSDEAIQEANVFNIKQHLASETKTAISNKIDALNKIASIYNQIVKL